MGELFDKLGSRSFKRFLCISRCKTTVVLSLQSWLSFSKLHKPFFAEYGSVGFPNMQPPLDEENNAYCKVRAINNFEDGKIYLDKSLKPRIGNTHSTFPTFATTVCTVWKKLQGSPQSLNISQSQLNHKRKPAARAQWNNRLGRGDETSIATLYSRINLY